MVGRFSPVANVNKKSEYLSYIKSAKWKRLADVRKAYDHYKCTRCGSEHELQVHHKNYPSVFGKESIFDLQTLCRSCHQKISKYNVSERIIKVSTDSTVWKMFRKEKGGRK